jgi:hypothetical protein
MACLGVVKLRGDAALGVRVNVNGLAGTSKEKVLTFFDGDEIMPGSTFSPSESLGVLGSYERLLVVGVVGIVKVNADFSALPPSMLDLLSRADKPDGSQRYEPCDIPRWPLTILTVFQVCKVLETWIVQRCKGHSSHGRVGGHFGWEKWARRVLDVTEGL